jgi:DNA-binding transcriptional LysR family regulator
MNDLSVIDRFLDVFSRCIDSGFGLLGGKVAFLTATLAVIDTGATQAVKQARSDLVGIVKIACPPAAIHVLDRFPERVVEAHPGLGVELLSGRGAVDLARGEADIAIRVVQPSDLDLVVAHRFEMGSCVYAAEAYLAAHGRPAALEDLARHRLVRYAEPFLHLPAFGWIEQFASPGAPAVRVDSLDLARSRIAFGAGIGVLCCVLGDRAPGVGRVFEAPIDRMTTSIVYHRAMRGSPRMRGARPSDRGTHPPAPCAERPPRAGLRTGAAARRQGKTCVASNSSAVGAAAKPPGMPCCIRGMKCPATKASQLALLSCTPITWNPPGTGPALRYGPEPTVQGDHAVSYCARVPPGKKCEMT